MDQMKKDVLFTVKKVSLGGGTNIQSASDSFEEFWF